MTQGLEAAVQIGQDQSIYEGGGGMYSINLSIHSLCTTRRTLKTTSDDSN